MKKLHSTFHIRYSLRHYLHSIFNILQSKFSGLHSIFNILHSIFRWATATRLRKALSIVLIILIVLTSIRYIFFIPKDVLADSLIKFDEGYGTTVNDSSGTSSGTITGATWKPEDLCFAEKCLFFDGSDWISFGDEASYDFAAATDFTVQFWFRHGPATATEVIIQKFETVGADGGYRIQMESDGDISFGVDDANDNFVDDNITSTAATYDDNNWHFVSAVKDGTTGIYLYIDGNLIVSDTTIGSTGDLTNDDTFYIGDSNGADGGDEYIGFLDEVKVYTTSARTITEIKADLTSSTPDRGTSASFGPTQDQLSNGLVGYWKMDEGSWNGTAGEVIDSSGNGNGATTTNNPLPVSGKYGNAINFNGTSQFANIAAPSTLLDPYNQSWTITAWIKTTSTADKPYIARYKGENALFEISNGSGIPYGYIRDNSGNSATVTQAANVSFSDNIWHSIALVIDKEANLLRLYTDGKANGTASITSVGSIDPANNNPLCIGGNNCNSTPNYFPGSIDEVRVYNLALSEAKVRALYDWAPGPVAHWKMDESGWNGTSGEVKDSSTNNLNGTATSATNDAGKYGNSGKFDGNGDYVTVADANNLDFAATDTFSVNSWFKKPLPTGQILEANHETNSFSQYTSSVTDSGDLSITAASAMDGTNYGISALIDDTTAIYATKSGLADTSGKVRARFYFDPNSLTMADTNAFTLMKLYDNGGLWVGAIFLRYEAAIGYQIQIGLDHDPGTNYSSYIWVSDEPHIIEVYLTRATTSSSTDGLMKLWIDGNYRQGLIGYDNYDSFASLGSINIGAVDGIDAGTSGTFYVDELIVKNGGSKIEPWQEADHEDNSLAREYNAGVIDSGDLSVSSAAALAGTAYGMSANIDDATAIYTYNDFDTLDFTGKFRFRFYFDPNSLTMGNLESFYLAYGVNTAWEALYRVDIRYSSGYQINLTLYDDAGTTHLSSWYAITDAPHAIEVYLQRAANSGSSDGSAQLWIDGVSQETVSGKDNYDRFSSLLHDRFGATGGLDAGTSGTFYIDEIAGNIDGSSATPSQYTIINKAETVGSDGGYQLKMKLDGDISFGITDANTLFPKDSVTSTSGAYDDGNWHYATAVKNGTASIQLYIDGQLIGTDSSLATTGTLANNDNLLLGISGDTIARSWSGNLDDVKIYNYARTPKQIIEDMNASHPAPGSPVGSAVAYWKLDEGYGTAAFDESTNANTLTLSAVSWTDAGKFSKAWNGDGAKWLARADDPDFDFGSTEDFTLSLWAKSDSASLPGTSEVLINKHVATNNPGYRLSFNTTGQIVCEIDDDTSSFPEDTAQTTTNYYDAAWHQIVCLRSGSGDDLDLYVDGQFTDDDGNLDATGDLANGDNLSIGDEDESNDGDEFFGDIDEIKIFRSALTADQIKLLYNQGKSAVFGALSTSSSGAADNSTTRSHCVPGDTTSTCNAPVSYWTFDENTGTGTDAVHDSSLNNWDGDMDASMTNANWIQGAIGSSVFFDATDDRLALGNYTGTDSLTAMSVSVWIKPNFLTTEATNHTIIETGPLSFVFNPATDDYSCTIAVTTPAATTVTTTSVTWNQNSWHHLACVYDGATVKIYWDGNFENSAARTGTLQTNVSGKYIGYSGAAGYWKGALDELAIYNFGFTPAQVAWNFNQGKPIAAYRFDECTGTTGFNAISKTTGEAGGNDSTITIGATGSNTAAGTCGGISTDAWYNGVTGKRNSSIDLDGTNDYVTVADDDKFSFGTSAVDRPFSAGLWFNNDTGSGGTLVARDSTGATSMEYRFYWENTTDLKVQLITSTTGSAIGRIATGRLAADDTWAHYLFTYDGSETSAGIKIYVNGQRADDADNNSGSYTGMNNTGAILSFGARDTDGTPINLANGKFDEVKIWGYDLTGAQVKTEYNNGAVNFGPNIGSP